MGATTGQQDRDGVHGCREFEKDEQKQETCEEAGQEVSFLSCIRICHQANSPIVRARFEQGWKVPHSCESSGVTRGKDDRDKGNDQIPAEESIVHGCGYWKLRHGGEASFPECSTQC